MEVSVNEVVEVSVEGAFCGGTDMCIVEVRTTDFDGTLGGHVGKEGCRRVR